MLDRLGEQYGVPVHEVGVGFKYVDAEVIETDAIIGGEESGGYAFKGHVPERDGIVAGLFVADMMVKTGKRPSELIELLFSKVGHRHFYDRVDAHFPADPARPRSSSGSSRRRSTRSSARRSSAPSETNDGEPEVGDPRQRSKQLADDPLLGGAEPIMRIYTETTDQARVKRILDFGKELAGI